MLEKRVEESLILAFIALGERLKRRRDRLAQGLNISTQQWLILLYLAKDPNLPRHYQEQHHKPFMASEIADFLNVSRPNITNLLKGLLEKGLIVQLEDEADKRRKRLGLTEKGQTLVMTLQPHRQRLNEQLFRAFEGEERNQLLRTVENLLQKLHFDAL